MGTGGVGRSARRMRRRAPRRFRPNKAVRFCSMAGSHDKTESAKPPRASFSTSLAGQSIPPSGQQPALLPILKSRRGALKSTLALGLTLLSACTSGLGPAHPGDPDRLKAEANALLAAGNPELAIDFYAKAASVGGMSSEILAGIGTANLLLGREREAENYLRAALEQDEDNPLALNNLGVILARRGESASAARLFKAAYALTGAEHEKIAANLKHALAKSRQTSYSAGNEQDAYAILLPDHEAQNEAG